MDIKKNSLEAVIFFSAYISAQDNKIAEGEFLKILENSKVIKTLKAHALLDSDNINIDALSKSLAKKALNSENILGKTVSESEKNLICSILTDPELIDISIRSSRIAASADGLHDKENHKLVFWLNHWGLV
ncbi:MAG: hypothetical protein VW986_00385 [Gammaproteobacteria bacterium]